VSEVSLFHIIYLSYIQKSQGGRATTLQQLAAVLGFLDLLEDLILPLAFPFPSRKEDFRNGKTYLQHLSTRTKGIDPALLQAIVIQLNEILPPEILEVIRVLVQAETPKPVRNIREQTRVSGVLRGLGAATATARRATAIDVVAEKAVVVVTASKTE
jgi:hypothetical protein